LRHANYFPESVKEKLKVPEDEYTLIHDSDGKWKFQSMQYSKHRINGINGWSNIWNMESKFDNQPLKLRMETLMSAEPYDSAESILVSDFTDMSLFSDRANAQGINASLIPSAENSAIYTAMNDNATAVASWSKFGRHFTDLNLSNHQALGVWIKGDGKGEVLNFQIKSPEHISGGIGEHYVIVDFVEWRYFELIEPEGECFEEYKWPYGGAYSIYRESPSYSNIESISLWYNNIPAGDSVKCEIKPIKAMPLKTIKIINPKITIKDKTITFPVEIETGCYLEFNSMSDCKLYGQKGELLSEVVPQGEVPIIEKGDNKIKMSCDNSDNINIRARVTLISKGEILG